jgi:hypothetical protein
VRSSAAAGSVKDRAPAKKKPRLWSRKKEAKKPDKKKPRIWSKPKNAKEATGKKAPEKELEKELEKKPEQKERMRREVVTVQPTASILFFRRKK